MDDWTTLVNRRDAEARTVVLCTRDYLDALDGDDFNERALCLRVLRSAMERYDEASKALDATE
jgi:hypothetical protein